MQRWLKLRLNSENSKHLVRKTFMNIWQSAKNSYAKGTWREFNFYQSKYLWNSKSMWKWRQANISMYSDELITINYNSPGLATLKEKSPLNYFFFSCLLSKHRRPSQQFLTSWTCLSVQCDGPRKQYFLGPVIPGSIH